MASLALAIGGIAAGVGAIGGAAIGGSAAESAADTQAGAAEYAANLQNQEFEQTQANEAPWLQAGQVSLGQIMSGLQPGGQFSTPFQGTFTPPTAQQASQTPGYQFTQEQGEQAIERGAAAAGGAFTGGTLKSLDAFDTGLADQTYQQTYSNALNTFQTQFNTYNTNQSNLYNRLASSSGLGQTTATQLGQLGQQATTNEGNLITSGAAAQAAGTVGAANAYTAGLQGLTNNISGYASLSALMNGGGSTYAQPTTSFSLPGAGYGGPGSNAPVIPNTLDNAVDLSSLMSGGI